MKVRAALLVALTTAGTPAYAQQPPAFQSGVEVLPLDVTVVDRDETLRRARQYAARYADAGGTEQPLVALWVHAVEK